MLVDGLGCWLSPRADCTAARGMPALFLDRDDVLLADPGYLHRAADVQLLEGAAKVVRWANFRSVPAIVITNQSGIGRGLFGWDAFHAVNERMHALLADEGAKLDAIAACAWHEQGLPHLSYHNHPWRKPNPGMFLAAAEWFGCELSSSWMVGDRITDMEAACNAGLCGGILITQTESSDQLWLRENGDVSFEVVNSQSMNDVDRIINDRFFPEGTLRTSADAL